MGTKSKFALSGASGKMGKAVIELAKKEDSLELALGIGRTRADLGEVQVSPVSAEMLKGVDLVIDFSSADFLRKLIPQIVSAKVPLLSGTTGLTPEDLKSLDLAAQHIPVLWSANLSVGMAFMRRALRQAQALHKFSFAIQEIHHAEKKDSPSGTALELVRVIKEVTGFETEVSSLRAHDEPGLHTVTAVGPGEIIALSHQALSRNVFAMGALTAAKWLIAARPKPGRYQIDDVIN